jgi:1,2-phenylacetyl-CoA epoxidase PaaB subunit
MMWIVHRVVLDNRSMSGKRLQAIGWLKADDEDHALMKAKKIFGSSLKLVAVSDQERDWGWL